MTPNVRMFTVRRARRAVAPPKKAYRPAARSGPTFSK